MRYLTFVHMVVLILIKCHIWVFVTMQQEDVCVLESNDALSLYMCSMYGIRIVEKRGCCPSKQTQNQYLPSTSPSI